MKRGPYYQRRNFERMWPLRDGEVHGMFYRIDAWLARPINRGQFITKYYDDICKQWLEFAVISARQKDVLKQIIERWNIP